MSDEDGDNILRRRTTESQIDFLVLQVGLLNARILALESKSKGGRPGKKIQVQAEHVCGLDPSIDSDTCPNASLYRRRQGCMGDACMRASSEYYKDRHVD